MTGKGARVPRSSEQVRRGYDGPRPAVSVVVLTLNEEINIRECLESCCWSDDVHVLDSGSEDRTRAIAEELGAGIHVHPFESFGKQRNWAIDNIPLEHEWVFHLDADERFTPEIVAEMDELLRADPEVDGFHVPHKLMFMGRWLKLAGGYPTYQMRLFSKHRMRFIDHGHGQREQPNHKLGTMVQPYLHYVFSKGLYDWIDKHNRYSSLEALQVERDRRRMPGVRAFFDRNPVERRRAWKQLGYRLPFRPRIRWLVTMFVLGAVIEGKAGRTYAQLLRLYEEMIDLKLRLMRSRAYRTAAQQSQQFERDTTPAARTRVFEAPDRPTQAPSAQGSTPQAGDTIPATLPPYEMAPPGPEDQGQLLPESSPWSFREKLMRAVWMIMGKPVFRMSFHNWYGFRVRLLRLFGARIGSDVRIRPSVNVEIPWNIDIRDGATIGDNAILYSLGQITIGERTIVSQYAHLCAGTHDHTDRRFPLIRDPIMIGSDAWIGADAYVGPNVSIGNLSVLGARSSAYKNLDPGVVYVGNPAKALKQRELQ